jgi:ankyrin repeat protein
VQAINKAIDASSAGDLARVRRMIKGSSINAQGRGGTTVLMAAAAAGQDSVMSWLLHKKSKSLKLNRKCALGNTALNWAARYGNEAAVAALLDGRADANAANADGYTPLATATHEGHVGIVRRLLAAGADTEL